MEAFYKVKEFSTIRELIDMSAEEYAWRPAFEIKKNKQHFYINYRDYREDLNAFCSAAIYYGLDGGAVGVCSNNRYEYAATYVGTILSGGVIVPTDKELHEDDITGIFETAEIKFFFCDAKFLSGFNIDRIPGVKIICYDSESADGERVMSWESFIAQGRRLNKVGKELYKNVKHDPEKLCTLLFTSGTMGAQKGVMLCQRNFVSEIKAAMGVLKIYPQDCGISLLPIHHTFESSIILFFAPYCGAKVTFCEGFKYVLSNMKEFNPTIFVAVPMVLEIVHKRIMKQIKARKNGEAKFRLGKALCKSADLVHIDLKKVFFKEIQDAFGGHMRMIICGGAPIDPQIIKDFDAFGIQVVYGYGLTECAPLAIINHDRCRTTDSIGEPLPGIDIKIYNPDENGAGEICIRGGNVMLGYYKDEESTNKVIDKEGFLHTGDIGYCDKKGRYHITGRSKSVIVTSNGKNVFPEELEYLLDKNSFINASMVEGIGELEDPTVMAQIYPDYEEIAGFLDKDPTEQEVIALVKKAVEAVNARVPDFKKIRKFIIRTEDFERTTAQKIKRGANTINETVEKKKNKEKAKKGK
ncbi:MAG: AMP-binding protein [Clostridia bacterium]|nr:AMP-binding protein [Clostridia bacterium]